MSHRVVSTGEARSEARLRTLAREAVAAYVKRGREEDAVAAVVAYAEAEGWVVTSQVRP